MDLTQIPKLGNRLVVVLVLRFGLLRREGQGI
jgi:hypothetical protein